MDNIISAINETTSTIDKGNFGNICQGCKFSGDMVYCSNPPKLKCEITGDFHLFGDKCNCKNIISDLHHALKYFESHMFIADERRNHTGVLIDECKHRLPKIPGNQYMLTDKIKTGKCPTCNNPVNSDERFCSHCGQLLYWRESTDYTVIAKLTDLTEEYNTAIKSNSEARQNLQNIINVIDITDESSQSLKAAYDLAVKLLEVND